MNFEFSIRDDINIRARSLIDLKYKDYSKPALARAVAFYLDLIQASNHEKIGVAFGALSLLSVAFMLALHKSGREYTMVYHDGTFDYDKYKHLYSHLFFAGVVTTGGRAKINSFVSDHPNLITLTDTKSMESSALSYYKSDDLIFDFSKNKKISIVNIINIDDVALLYTTEKIEGSSIDAAMKHYFHEDDYVVMMRPLQHVGVATLSIYPAFFKAKNISLCVTSDDWTEEYHNATHVHIDPHMMRIYCELPKKLRMLTSGGYNFNSECAEYVTSRSDIENIVDCFGTARCPPPLAIRQLLTDKIFKANNEFEWVNEFVTLNKHEYTNQLMFSAVDDNVFNALQNSFNNTIVTDDTIKLHDCGSKFSLTGKLVLDIRMAHTLYTVNDFKKLFAEYSGINDFHVEYEWIDGLKNPSIVVNEEDYEVAQTIMSKFYIEAKLKIK
jgi:hypothetical protein